VVDILYLVCRIMHSDESAGFLAVSVTGSILNVLFIQHSFCELSNKRCDANRCKDATGCRVCMYAAALDLLCTGTCQSQWLDFTRNLVVLVEMASAHTVDFIIPDVTVIPLLFLSRKILQRRLYFCFHLFDLFDPRFIP